jgi:hypothetical protein
MKKHFIFYLSVTVIFLLLASCNSKCGSCPTQATDTLSVTFQTGLYPSTAYGQTNVKDAYIDQANPTTNYASDTDFNVGNNAGTLYHGVIQFQIDGYIVPPNSQIVKAYLTLGVENYNGADGIPVIKAYDEQEMWIYPTWLQRDSIMQMNWTTPGGDYNSALAGDNSIFVTGGAFVTVPLNTAMVSRWITDPASNKGIFLKSANETLDAYFALYSNDNPDTTLRPKLTVYYRLP